MIVLLQSMRRMSTVSKKLVVLIVAFSSIITLFLTVFQLFLDYRVQRAGMDEMVERISVFLPPLAASVWRFDDQQITLTLESLVNLPVIERARVRVSDGDAAWTAQSAQSEHQQSYSYALTHPVRGEMRTIATLDLVIGLDNLYQTLFWQGVSMLLGNALKTFLVAAFIFAATRRLVTLRIEELARRVAGLVPQMAAECATPVEDVGTGPGRGDEIDAVRWAFDGMAERLKLLVADLGARNQQLAAENRERQRAEAELRDAVGQLSTALVEVERFAYVAAHDLQEPIRSIVSFSQLLERRCGEALSEQGLEYLGFITTEARRLSALVNDLLAYSRCKGESMAHGPVDCGRVLAEVRHGLNQAIADSGAIIESGRLPILPGDGGQLHQLFQNLLSNALKFARPGVPPHISVTAEAQDGQWLFRLADNGIGIDGEYVDYVFEAFRRLHTRDRFPGTGVGLAICKRVVENHGGRLWLESVPGQGTTFLFALPDRDI